MPILRAEPSAPSWRFPLIVAVICAVRLAVAGSLHLTEDEAYYRLWSMAPAFGYYDHPPMIAGWIGVGRALAGDTPLGVRLLPVLASAALSLLVRDMARLAGGGSQTAERAGIWFNATLLVSVGGFLAVPDAPAALFWCLTLWCLLRAVPSAGVRWWAAAGVSAGCAALSKYSALFLGPGVLLWLLWTPESRRALRTPGPWLALTIATALFGLNVAWNATHHWFTFEKQFGRVAGHALSWRFLPELLLTQALLLNPLVALWLARSEAAPRTPSNRLGLFVATSLPFAGYLVIHSLHDRVQAHWPAPIYPALAVLAAFAADGVEARRLRQAVPGVAIAVTSILAILLVLPPTVWRAAPDLFLPLRGWRGFAAQLDHRRAAAGAEWTGTTSYGLASELADEHPRAPILQISERDRWRRPTTSAAIDPGQPGLVVDLPRRVNGAKLAACFAEVRSLGPLPRGALGEKPMVYALFLVAKPRHDIVGEGCW